MKFNLQLTPEDEAKLDAEREAHLVAYRRRYWQQYKVRNKRVYGTLTKPEFAEIKAIADYNGRSVWEQIWLESCAYRKQEYLPSTELNGRIEALYVELRRIGNNLNQIARSHNSGKLIDPHFVQTSEQIATLENAVSQFIARSHKHVAERK